MSDPNAAPADDTLEITRVFEVPREKVWSAWTEPRQLMRWWGPEGFTAPSARIDFRPGGTYLSCMRGPDGKDYWTTGTYREIVPMERIVYTDSFADADGNAVSAADYGMGDNWPLEMLVTLTFAETDCHTRFTLRHTGFPSKEVRDMCAQGWNESLDKLNRVLTEKAPA